MKIPVFDNPEDRRKLKGQIRKLRNVIWQSSRPGEASGSVDAPDGKFVVTWYKDELDQLLVHVKSVTPIEPTPN